jgi:uncharacterized membrane protein YccC
VREALRQLWLFWWDRLVASDAGLVRLTSAARITAAVILTFIAIRTLTASLPLPKTMIVLGIIESLFGSVAVRDPLGGMQRLTLLTMPLPAAAALAFGTALAPWPAAADAGFLAVIFAATYARRFGPRTIAFGMLSYISCFIGIFLHMPFAQLADQVLALAIGAAAAYVVRFWIVPDRPVRTLERVLHSFYRRIGQILDEIDAALAAGAWDEQQRRRMRRRVSQINATALAAEGRIEALDPDHLKPASQRSELGLRLFELEVVAGRLADAAVRQLPPAAQRAPMHDALDALRRALDAGPAAPRFRHMRFPAVHGDKPVARAMRNVMDALSAMPDVERGAHHTMERTAPAAGVPADTADTASGLLPTTRAAIQVTVACALAIVPGEFLSTRRWYWAVITVFVIFTGTQSRGDVFAKGMQRVAGTLAGVGAGVLIATAASGNHVLSLALIFACVFLAFYLLAVAYGLMIFWITIVISLLYGMLGAFSPQLFVLRIEETVVGAVIGVLVATFLLPTSSRENFRVASRAFLQALDDLVGRVCGPPGGNAVDGADLTAAARELDRRFHKLEAAGKPLVGSLSGALAPTQSRRWMRVFLACDHYARSLASPGQRAHGAAADDPACRRLATRIRANIGRVRAILDGGRRNRSASAAVRRRMQAERSRDGHAFDGDSQAGTPQRALAGIDEALSRLVRDVGVPEDQDG